MEIEKVKCKRIESDDEIRAIIEKMKVERIGFAFIYFHRDFFPDSKGLKKTLCLDVFYNIGSFGEAKCERFLISDDFSGVKFVSSFYMGKPSLYDFFKTTISSVVSAFFVSYKESLSPNFDNFFSDCSRLENIIKVFM